MEQASFNAIQSALQAVADLKLVSPLCSGSFDGRRTGRNAGGAMEFADYRSYRAGDHLRRIDWRVYAKSEQLMVRNYAQETDPRCDIIIDCSASMAFYDKSAAAAGMAAFLAQCALNAGFSLQVWALCDGIFKMNDASCPRNWELPFSEGKENPPEILQATPPGFYRSGMRIFLSDLFFGSPPRELMCSLGNNSVIIQLLGAEELDPAVTGTLTIENPENGSCRSVFGNEDVIRRYKERLSNFQREWAEYVRNCGSRIFFINASELLADWDMTEFCRQGVLQ